MKHFKKLDADSNNSRPFRGLENGDWILSAYRIERNVSIVVQKLIPCLETLRISGFSFASRIRGEEFPEDK